MISPIVKKLADENGISPIICEQCGTRSNNRLIDGNINEVRVIYKHPGGQQAKGNKVTSLKDFLFICQNCRYDYASKREELFRRLRG